MSATNDTRSSYSNFSENFAQSQDTAESWDPSDEAFAREGAALKARLDAAVAALDTARTSGSYAALMAAETEYEEVAELWVSYAETLKEDLLQRPGYISLADVLRMDLETGGELSSEEEHARVQALKVLIDYVMQSGLANLGGAFKNFLALVRRIRPEAMEGISQTDLAAILGERKATTQIREKKRVEQVAKRMGVKGFHFLGGTKSEETRQKSAAAARGNTNRRDGTRRRQAG